MNVKLEINGRTLEDRWLAVRVWAKQRFSWHRLSLWNEERFVFTISVRGQAASAIRQWLTHRFDEALRKDIIAEIRASGGTPGQFLDPDSLLGKVDRKPGWWDDLPQTGKIRTPQIDHRKASHEHARTIR